MKFSSTSNTSVQRYLYPLFQNQSPHFLLPIFSENYLNPQTRINKMVNKHTVNYHPSPSQLISRIHPLIFLWTPKGFISPESFLIFFLNLYIPLWLWKSFKFILLRLLVNTFVNQKIESVHFYSCPQATLPQVFISTSQAEGNYSFLLNRVFWRSIFSPAESGGGEDYGSEKISKIKPTKVLFTNFDKFHHLCIIDFCFVVP